MTSQEPVSLREQKKAEVRATIVSVSHTLFREQGFDATTLQELCAVAGISKRTLFRYFRDKEALIFPHREERLEAFVTFLNTHQQIENPFDALRMATVAFASRYDKNKEHLLSQQVIIQASAPLLAREREIDKDWQAAIATAFSARSGKPPERDLWARVLAGAIMGVVRATMNYWFSTNCEENLADIGLEALDYLELGFPNVKEFQS